MGQVREVKEKIMADEDELAPFDVEHMKGRLDKYELLDCIGTGKVIIAIYDTD